VISWCTYPVVYLFPMLGINHSKIGSKDQRTDWSFKKILMKNSIEN